MSRYIDADSLKRELKRNAMMALVEREETVDAVQVVRCGECRKQLICYHSDNYFCADGERKKNE